jgi:hypothetical protein
MKKADPAAVVTVHEFDDYIEVANTIQTVKKPFLRDKGGAWVKVSVTMNDRTETELLPVMDMRNKAVAEPDATTINKNIKRCFVKALALHGLGLFLYVGDDLPEAEPPKPATPDQIKALAKEIENMAQLAEIAYEKAEKGILSHLKLNKKLKDITNEEYGTMLVYINKMLPAYEKKAKEKAEAAKIEVDAEQVGMELQYNIPEK